MYIYTYMYIYRCYVHIHIDFYARTLALARTLTRLDFCRTHARTHARTLCPGLSTPPPSSLIFPGRISEGRQAGRQAPLHYVSLLYGAKEGVLVAGGGDHPC